MSIFVMVPGSWHGGWSFEPLHDLLTAAGHRLIALDLPGTDGSPTSLAQWTDTVVNVASEQSEPVILCAHSRGGIIISEAAERAPHLLKGLVYIAGFMLPSAISFIEYVQTKPRNPVFEAGITPTHDGRSLAISKEVARQIFYQLSPAAAAAAACERLLPEPIAPSLTPLSLTEARYGSVPRHYIQCTRDAALPIVEQQAFCSAQPCRSVTPLESDHSPFTCRPIETAEALIRIASLS